VELRGDVSRFCCGIVDAVAPHVVAVKPQLAFFEALGAAGIAAFEQVCQYAKRVGLLVIADGKRGDIGSTARAYSEAYIEGDPPLADALTVNPWLGRDAVDPFLGAVRRGGVGIFVLVRTSNAGGDLQDAVLKDGRPMWHYVAELVDEWGAEMAGEVGLSSVGAVVGATHPRAVAEARRLMPRSILLLPGVGAQGGAVSDLTRAFQSGPASAIVPVSRSVIYAFRDAGSDYREAAGAEAARLKREIWTASGW
jgi:orotidine-5'-phosphate decarboxylase